VFPLPVDLLALVREVVVDKAPKATING